MNNIEKNENEVESDRLLNSELQRLIAPEIKHDEFYFAIQQLVSQPDIKTILEIGSSSGEGSTEAFVKGIQASQNQPTLFCMEVSKPRFTALQKRYTDNYVKSYNVSSVPVSKFPKKSEVAAFYNSTQTALNSYPLDQVLGWLHQDIEYIEHAGVYDQGIKLIKQENQIDVFDLVLIDGSEFTGTAELAEVYGAKYILLDDINAFKNYRNHQNLRTDKNYELLTENLAVRNGYSIFKRINDELVNQLKVPIHFFTIVLNGQPFIQYHIDIFKQLPFRWHWHIVEGVAALTHDTAWSVSLGGKVTQELHNQGRSNDGTTQYLDELAKLYPENITIYRQPEGTFWDGKLAMVNAPLVNIHEECLLWQIDVDELWTVQQLCTAKQMFSDHPDKTAAFLLVLGTFVGEKLMVSTRHCYSQNPQQEWLRTWRYKPGAVWAAHEPPILVENRLNEQWVNVASVNPFSHEETEEQGLVFQHFAYVTEKQLQFKEQYYGYKNAVSQWMKLQSETKLPAFLRDYFPWVQDDTRVAIASDCGVVPIAQTETENKSWRFLQPEEIKLKESGIDKKYPRVVIDGVFFQLYKTGIGRVWHSLLEEWVETGFAKHILFLDRAGTAPKISGIWYRPTPAYDLENISGDREMLQQICDEEEADVFISTYYTTPLSTPHVLLVHDMIPEILEADPKHPFWRGKHHAIQKASAWIAVSENTARDLIKFFPDISEKSITIAHNGIKSSFSPASTQEISQLKLKYGIAKPYFLLVGAGIGYKNSMLFFKAFSQLFTKTGFEIVCTGSGTILETDFRIYTSGVPVHMLQLSDEELIAAYSGAVALIYPSNYEGFGLPVLEAIACGCPVITCPNSSLPEVAGEAALYVSDRDVYQLADALCEVQKPQIRKRLIAAGLEQAKKFSWSKMAEKMASVLIKVSLQRFKLRETNFIIFPDWSQPEEIISQELQRLLRAIATHQQANQTTLLVMINNIAEDDAELILSGVAMNLLMEDELDISEGLEVSLASPVSKEELQFLCSKVKSRIRLETELVPQSLELPVIEINSFYE